MKTTVQEPVDLSTGISCPAPIMNHKNILLAHGGGGKLTNQLIKRVFATSFANTHLAPLHDGAVLEVGGARIAFSTDSFVVSPIFFPGGDIGDLAVNGTVNDLAMCGARPLYISCGMIIEEGLPMEELQRVVGSMQRAAKLAGVQLVTGDTKVVDRGKADKLFINTSGIGEVIAGVRVDPGSIRAGDVVVLSGEIATHGIAIMSVREGLEFESAIASDTVALNRLVERIVEVCPEVRVMRDPTRGGIASALNELAEASGTGIEIAEESIPISGEVRGACEILGLDPLYVANEGKMLAVVPETFADLVLETMRSHPLGKNAAIIGRGVAGHPGTVVMKSRIGGTRVVDMLSGEQLPRIC